MGALVLIGLFLLITVFIPWVNFFRFGSMQDDIRRLARRIRQLEDAAGISEKDRTAFQPAKPLSYRADEKLAENKPEPLPPVIEKSVQPLPRVIAEPEQQMKESTSQAVNPPYESPYNFSDIKSSFEENIATKLPVWIGAISLICAAFFLIKYSVELGWFGPSVRVIFGALFGGALLVGGQWIAKREHIANFERISQGLVGAGLVTLYGCIYAAVHLHELIPPVMGFGGMAIITAMAVILSLRHGQPIAVFGLVGGLLTPMLIGSDEPNAIAMFAYLFVLFSGMFSILVRKGWWKLAVLSLVGVFSWSAFWFAVVFSANDAFVLVLFAMALSVVVMVVTGRMIVEGTAEKNKAPIHTLNFTAVIGSVITIAWLSFKISLSLFDWSMLGLLSLGMFSLAYFQPQIYLRPLFSKLVATLLLFSIWTIDAPFNEMMIVLSGIAFIYIGASALIMRAVDNPRTWAVLQAVTALSLYFICYCRWGYGAVHSGSEMMWGYIALALAVPALMQAAEFQKKYATNTAVRDFLVAVYAFTASAFITTGLVIELPFEYLAIAVAGQIAATAWIYYATRIISLKHIMSILTFGFIALNYEQIILFGSIVVDSIVGDKPSVRGLRSYVLEMPLLQLGVPAILLSAALWVVIKLDKMDLKIVPILSVTVLGLVSALFYYLFRGAFHGDLSYSMLQPASFIERSVLTMLCIGAGMAFVQSSSRFNIPGIRKAGMVLFYLGVARFVYFDLLLLNPYWSDGQFVGDIPLLNGITLTYGLGMILFTWAAMTPHLFKQDKIYKVLSLICLFAFSSFTVRQIFHGGDLMHGHISSAELYSYSAIWLISGLALLTLGIKVKNKMIRMASVGFVLLTILKVFLVDIAELEGLYRVVSFFGLGVSLIGLSYFYTKFVSVNELNQKED